MPEVLRPFQEPIEQENIEILTPEKVKAEDAPTQLWVWTKKYGETVSTLKPGFEREARKIEGEYSIEVPHEVMDICREVNSLGGKALLVGGCVRDAVISVEVLGFDLEPKDFDIEIYGLSPQTLSLVLETKFGDVRTEGESFAVLKIPVEGLPEPIDASIPRRESKSGKGHKGFTIEGDPTMSISEAALRRDLTINSLAYDPLTETLYDAYNGVEHIKEGVIEVTNEEAFQEDPLRVLRVMQFASRFEFGISGNTLKLCKEMIQRGDLDELPSERITEEVKKLFTKGRKPSIGLEFAREAGIVERYWPEMHAMVGVEQDEQWHPEGDVWRHTLQVVDSSAQIAERERLSKDDRLVLTLASLAHDFGKPATTEFKDGTWKAHGHEAAGVEPTQEFLDRFDLPNDIKKKVVALVPDHLAPKYFWEQEVKHGVDMRKAVNRLANRLGKGDTNIYMISLLAEADQCGRNPDSSSMEPLSRDQVAELEAWQTWLNNKATELRVTEKPPERLLNGRDLLVQLPERRGGVWLGCVLDAVYADQLDGEVLSEQDALSQGLRYMELFSGVVGTLAEKEAVDERQIWGKLRRYEDPRVILQSSTELSVAV